MLDPDRDLLGQDSSLNAFVDDDADGVLGHVEHATRLAVVGLVRHALLEGAVTLQRKQSRDHSTTELHLQLEHEFCLVLLHLPINDQDTAQTKQRIIRY